MCSELYVPCRNHKFGFMLLGSSLQLFGILRPSRSFQHLPIQRKRTPFWPVPSWVNLHLTTFNLGNFQHFNCFFFGKQIANTPTRDVMTGLPLFPSSVAFTTRKTSISIRTHALKLIVLTPYKQFFFFLLLKVFFLFRVESFSALANFTRIMNGNRWGFTCNLPENLLRNQTRHLQFILSYPKCSQKRISAPKWNYNKNFFCLFAAPKGFTDKFTRNHDYFGVHEKFPI